MPVPQRTVPVRPRTFHAMLVQIDPTATTTVYDSKGTVLFDIKRAGRGTDARATVSVAKEIIKRILKLRSYGGN